MTIKNTIWRDVFPEVEILTQNSTGLIFFLNLTQHIADYDLMDLNKIPPWRNSLVPVSLSSKPTDMLGKY